MTLGDLQYTPLVSCAEDRITRLADCNHSIRGGFLPGFLDHPLHEMHPTAGAFRQITGFTP